MPSPVLLLQIVHKIALPAFIAAGLSHSQICGYDCAGSMRLLGLGGFTSARFASIWMSMLLNAVSHLSIGSECGVQAQHLFVQNFTYLRVLLTGLLRLSH